ncbi:hypothetical protein [Rhizobium sp. GN54]|uniref:hypothetical protein n=1 Tax=Rhizobium sp. GN54 TaxID=2898150 RepID=UPI001E445B41|nr:hypothetical protein [Rhizobium sp. GN54]MCD2182444.1 hypothetical protein [Rhizobium sp. GN54]
MAALLIYPLNARQFGIIYCASQQGIGPREESKTMNQNRNGVRHGFLGRAFAVLGAASAAAAAVEGNRRPKDRDLRTLGIDPASFPK